MKELLSFKESGFQRYWFWLSFGFGLVSDWFFGFGCFRFFQVRIQGFSIGFRISGIWFLRIRFLFFRLGRSRVFQVSDFQGSDSGVNLISFSVGSGCFGFFQLSDFSDWVLSFTCCALP